MENILINVFTKYKPRPTIYSKLHLRDGEMGMVDKENISKQYDSDHTQKMGLGER